MPLDPDADAPFPRFIEHKSTLAIPNADRFDCWRAWHPTVSLTPLSESASLELQGEIVRYWAPDGAVFAFTKCDSMDLHFGANNPAGDYLTLSMPVGGGGRATVGKSDMSLRPGGSFYLIDAQRPLRIRMAPGFANIHMSLPRRQVIEVMGRDPCAAGPPIVELGSRGLLGMADATLRSLVQRLRELDEAEMAAAVRMVASLVVTGLQRQLEIPGDVDRPGAYDVLFSTACRLIELYYADRNLAASTIAAATGCSRAHLYRAFARRGTTFANVLRDVRLSKARALLLGPRPRSIAQVAALTGYADQSSFSRAFHAAVGVTPRAWCRAHLHSQQLSR